MRKFFRWGERDLLGYALGVGCGIENDDAWELQFLRRDDIVPLPTFATVPARQLSAAVLGTDEPDQLSMLIHQKVILHSPLPTAASVLLSCSVETSAVGRNGTALRRATRTEIEAEGGEPLATVESHVITTPERGHRSRDRPAADLPITLGENFVTLMTLPNQALIYSLCGDRNPLHVDPESARAAGFRGPVLHGLCTFGLSCRAVIRAYCPENPGLVASHEADFCAPVYPGDTLRFDMRREDESILFEGLAVERATKVIRSGKTILKKQSIARSSKQEGTHYEYN